MQREGDVALRVWGKRNKERVVGLPKQAVTAIEAYLATRPGAQPEEPMFLVSGGRRITARVVDSNCMGEAHTYATRLHEFRTDLLVIQELLGHESVDTTEIYTRVSAARQREAIRRLEGGFSA